MIRASAADTPASAGAPQSPDPSSQAIPRLGTAVRTGPTTLSQGEIRTSAGDLLARLRALGAS
jgi:hypothetical protein